MVLGSDGVRSGGGGGGTRGRPFEGSAIVQVGFRFACLFFFVNNVERRMNQANGSAQSYKRFRNFRMTYGN